MALKELNYKESKIRIAYTLLNNNANDTIVFLHGWGSNKELMQTAFGAHFKDFNHIYIDLPGFGKSSTDIVLNTYDYAKIIESFLQILGIFETHLDSNNTQNLDSKKNKNRLIIAGHSFGGKIALLLKHEIILLSSAGILLPKSLKVKAKIFLAKILKCLHIKASALRAADAAGLNQTMYEIFKVVVNEDFSREYSEFKLKASVFWGQSDKATPLKCYEKILSLMPQARGFILEGDHYFFLSQGEKIEMMYKS